MQRDDEWDAGSLYMAQNLEGQAHQVLHVNKVGSLALQQLPEGGQQSRIPEVAEEHLSPATRPGGSAVDGDARLIALYEEGGRCGFSL